MIDSVLSLITVISLPVIISVTNL